MRASDFLRIALIVIFFAPAQVLAGFGPWSPHEPTPEHCAAENTNAPGVWTSFDVVIDTDPVTQNQSAWCRTKCTNQTLCGVWYGSFGNNGTGHHLHTRDYVPTSCPPNGTVAKEGYFDYGTNGSPTSLPANLVESCDSANNCRVELGQANSVSKRGLVDGVYHYYGYASLIYDGSPCTPTQYNSPPGVVDPAQAQSCATGQTMVVTTTGETACYTTPAPDPLNPDVPPDPVKEPDPFCVTNPTSPMCAPASTSTDTGKFCAENPDSAMCKPAETFSQYCLDNPDSLACATLGTVADEPLGEKTIDVGITPVAIGGAGSCPAPSALVLHGQTYMISWTTYCNFSTGVKPIILVFAWLAAAGILVGGFKT